jgi:uncharacterized OsmC-like protein
MKDLGIDGAKVHVEMDYYLTGSVLKGTVESGCSEVRIHFQIDSTEADDEILEIVRLAKRGCYVENMVRAAVPLESSYTLNGTPVAVSLD